MRKNQIFKDLLVVELASVLAGPAVGMFFAELGARVIKIENKKTGGDVTRRWKLPSEDPQSAASAYYHSINWGKEVHFLDLSNDADHTLAMDWISRADVVISNFRPDSARKMGFAPDQLRGQFPGLIFGQITGFGENSDKPAFDIVLQAEAGFLYMTGDPDRAPSRMPVALIDLLAAHQLKEGILLALLQKERQGTGALVSVSLRDAAVASLANQASNWLVAGHIPQRMGSRHPNIAPYGDIFTTADGRQIVLAVGNDKQFHSLCLALQLEALAEDQRFSSNEQRVQHRTALNEYLEEAIAGMDLPAVEAQFHARQVPFGRVRNMEEVFADPEVQTLVLDDDQGGKRVRTAVFQIS
ncbi:CaiB/BaiF CoA transferase family protein [Flavilitoribacter nigricans]|uniref:Carnitine dehydratase n=1 Tax=Flavilitoribacter nigricans (strain ATCC 23147 / DSM 23189 / NBRC 102662 / NCIMB 1420 / SS-2) TaxID=1122177 RepID=A0A2D0ND25_FLAN2|nr:CaiB/BaiF CoA-transferase family protein [Flavilitoribacter nigricans]PHN05673.1 carnitine dehydratase [Flavilitoribacter nigricans DSM 23189 = NBRC 102662]